MSILAKTYYCKLTLVIVTSASYEKKAGNVGSIHFIFLELETRILSGCSGDGRAFDFSSFVFRGGSQFTPSLFPTIRYVPCRMMYDLDGRQEVENEPAVLCTHAGSMTNHRSWMRRPPPASPATNDTFAEHAFQAERFHQELVNGFHSLRICFRLFVDRRRVFDVWPLLQGGNYFVFVDD